MPLTPFPAAAATTRLYRNAGAPTNGTSGTLATIARKGDLLIDYTNAALYMNTNTQASPTWTAFANISPAELTSLLAAIPTAAVTHVAAADVTGAAGANPTQAEYATVVTLLNQCKAAINSTLARLETAGIVTP